LSDVRFGHLEKWAAGLDALELFQSFIELPQLGAADTKVETGFVAENALIKADGVVVMIAPAHFQNVLEQLR
jgi:hypothetical protein